MDAELQPEKAPQAVAGPGARVLPPEDIRFELVGEPQDAESAILAGHDGRQQVTRRVTHDRPE